MKKDKHKKELPVSRIFRIMHKPLTIAVLLGIILAIGLPLRMQNMKLDGYISDDAWWHYRQIKETIEFGRRLNPDPYEFTTLNRPMTYPPLFHYTIAASYKMLGKGMSLVNFTNYFNILEAVVYILLIYYISFLISGDKLFSLIGALGASVSYGLIIRARTGELMPFVLGDLFALGAIPFLLKIIKSAAQKISFWFSLMSGILMGLSILSWNGGALIYLPLVLFAYTALIINKPQMARTALKHFFVCLSAFLIVCLPWYLPFLMKFGLKAHSQEMEWFMKGFTVLHQFKPFNFYILTSGVAIFFIPVVFLGSLLKKEASGIFFNLWIVLGIIATFVGWRGYVAVVPIISAIAMSIGVSWIIHFFFKDKTWYVPVAFAIIFLGVAIGGDHISRLRLAPLDANNPNEVRTNARSIKMLYFLKEKYPEAVTIDHITWMSEDEAVGSLRMIGGQYLEYLPQGSSQVLKDISRAYLSEEEQAYKIFQKYNAELIIVRKQLLQIPQLSLLFAPPESKPDEYLKVIKENASSDQITVNFTPKGMQSMLFRMLNRQNLTRFELVYSNQDKDDPLPFVVVYKIKK